MITLITTVIFGLIFGYFATQNTLLVTIYFWTYTLPAIPLYIVVLASLSIGLIVPAILSFIKSLTTSLKINKKEGQLNKSQEEVSELTKSMHKLELENTKLKTEMGRGDTDEDSL